MDIEATSDDGSLDSAVAAITAKLQAGDESARVDVRERENREDADVTELEESTDLDEAEREEREAKASTKDGKAPAEVEGKDGAEAEADDDAQFIELPPTEEGGEPVRIPAAEAAEAWTKLRQMDGETATAVIRAEEEVFQKHDQITQQLSLTLETVMKQAEAARQLMHAYAPAQPHPSHYQTAEDYAAAQHQYEQYWAHFDKLANTVKQAESGVRATGEQQDTEMTRRETERASRFIPEWKDEKTRSAKQEEIAGVLGPKYGIKIEDVREITDHRALRILNDLAASLKQAKAAPEVKKHLTETKPKIVKGRVSPDRDPNSGRFIDAASKELRETGTEDAFVKKLLRSGALKGF